MKHTCSALIPILMLALAAGCSPAPAVESAPAGTVSQPETASLPETASSAAEAAAFPEPVSEEESLRLFVSPEVSDDFRFYDPVYSYHGNYADSWFYRNFVTVTFSGTDGIGDKDRFLSFLSEETGTEKESIFSEDTQFLQYPALHLSWKTGGERTMQCEAFAIFTDSSVQVLHCRAEFSPETEELFREAADCCIQNLILLPEEEVKERQSSQALLCRLPEKWWLSDENASVLKFTEDGSVYLQPEDYFSSLKGDRVFSCSWEIRDGAGVFYDADESGLRPPAACELVAESSDSLLIRWPDGTEIRFRNTVSEPAASALEGGPLEYLSESPVLSLLSAASDQDADPLSVCSDEIIRIHAGDTAMLRAYGLSGSESDQRLFYLNPEPIRENLTFSEDSAPRILLLDQRRIPLLQEADLNELAERLKEEGSMAAELYRKDGKIIRLTQLYIP